MQKLNKVIIVFLSAVFIFVARGNIPINKSDSATPTITTSYKTPEITIEPLEEKLFSDEEVEAIARTLVEERPEITIEPLEEKPFSDEEVEAIARTLAGECYDDKMSDKRKVAEVILNRVSDGGFGENVIDVVTAKGQFAGYWNQSRPVSESDIQIAEETLTDWYANDCKALSEYLFFCSGPNRENVFRSEY